MKRAAAAGTTPLQAFLTEAQASRSDAVLVIKNGKVLVERYGGGNGDRLLPLMSVTKSVTSLAFGLLIGEGKIASVDLPVHTWFPERTDWKEGRKAKVTLRHLLTHESGLAHDETTEKLYASTDWLKYALALPVDTEPGTGFSYNNEAMIILGGIVQRASGKSIDRYLHEKLFRPLGIERTSWRKDKAGNVDTPGGLELRPRDLARIGQLER